MTRFTATAHARPRHFRQAPSPPAHASPANSAGGTGTGFGPPPPPTGANASVTLPVPVGSVGASNPASAVNAYETPGCNVGSALSELASVNVVAPLVLWLSWL